jgi:hypothetical protein
MAKENKIAKLIAVNGINHEDLNYDTKIIDSRANSEHRNSLVVKRFDEE